MDIEEIQQESLIKRLINTVLDERAPRPLSRNLSTNIEHDQELLSKTAHVRKPKEQLRQFFARVGLGVHQIRTMTKEQIKNFVAVATHNSGPGYFARIEDGSVGRDLLGNKVDAFYLSGKLIPDEEQLTAKVKSLLAPGEVLLQFIAKTGISTHQLRTLSLAEISRLADASATNYLASPAQQNLHGTGYAVSVARASAAYGRDPVREPAGVGGVVVGA